MVKTVPPFLVPPIWVTNVVPVSRKQSKFLCEVQGVSKGLAHSLYQKHPTLNLESAPGRYTERFSFGISL